jgi:hypothetical protein
MKFPRIALGFVMILVGLFMYVNAPVLFGQYVEVVRLVLQVYLILYAVVLATVGRGLPTINVDVYALRNFAVMFIVTVLIMSPFAYFLGATTTVQATLVLATGFGLLQFFKVFIEETIWGDIIKKYMGKYFSIVTFGLFHVSVDFIGGTIQWASIAVLMVLRYIWDYIHDRYGTFGSIGSHFGYNAIIMGMKVF